MSVLGDCPYEDCDGFHIVEGDGYGFSSHICETCNRKVWIKHSTLDPMAYTQHGFDEEFYIDGNAVVKKESGGCDGKK